MVHFNAVRHATTSVGFHIHLRKGEEKLRDTFQGNVAHIEREFVLCKIVGSVAENLLTLHIYCNAAEAVLTYLKSKKAKRTRISQGLELVYL